MKIAFINAYQLKVSRGAETFVEELSGALGKKHDVEVFSSGKTPLRRWPVIWRLFLDPPGLFILFYTLSLVPKLIKRKYDVVIPTNGGWQPAIVRIVTWIYGGKMLIIGHSGIGWDDLNNLWSFPDLFIALSNKAREWAKAKNPLIKSIYIPGGVNIELFKPKGLEYTLNLKRPVVLCVAALTLSKRVDLLIKAISQIGNVSLFVAGEGELQGDIEKLGKKLLKNRFKMKSFSHREIPSLYRSADLFCIPSSPSHSFELVILEAMASNLAVVANDDPIRKDIVGDAGILVDPTDINKYSRAIKKALRTEWKNIPRSRAENFSWDIVAKKYDGVFKSWN